MDLVQNKTVEHKPTKSRKHVIVRIVVIVSITVAVLLVIANLLLYAGFYISGKRNYPRYFSFGTYDELKDSLKYNTNVLFPDISEYSFQNNNYIVNKDYNAAFIVPKSKLYTGYNIQGRIDKSGSYIDLDISCFDLALKSKGNDINFESRANIKYFGIEMFENFDNYIETSVNEDNDTQDSNTVYRYRLEFSFSNCIYTITTTQLIATDELQTEDIDLILSNIKDVALKIAKSIIDQRGTK